MMLRFPVMCYALFLSAQRKYSLTLALWLNVCQAPINKCTNQACDYTLFFQEFLYSLMFLAHVSPFFVSFWRRRRWCFWRQWCSWCFWRPWCSWCFCRRWWCWPASPPPQPIETPFSLQRTCVNEIWIGDALHPLLSL